jgi:hypothetical protein
MKKVLHISHHIGCFRDQQYILNKLGLHVDNHKFTDNVFRITKEIADDFWNKNEELFNSYDYILISDTAPLSRPFLQNIEKLNPKLIIWICNRFDYAMLGDIEYYELFRNATNNPKITIVASTLFEKLWCLQHGSNIMFNPVINPLGKHDSDLNIPRANVFNEMYGEAKGLPDADVFVPFYHNDNQFFKMADYLRSNDLSVCNGTFYSPSQLNKYFAFVTLPDTFCKWFSFEAIHNNIPVLLPSVELLMKLSKQGNYLFNITGYLGAEILTEDLAKLSEWYNPKLEKCRYYFDSIEEIPNIIKALKNCDKHDFTKYSTMIESETLDKWKLIYK